MSGYKKIRGDQNQQNDIASPHNNFIQVFGDGSGKIVVCFFCGLVTIALIWMAVKETLLLESGVLLLFFLSVIGGSVICVCLVIRFVVGTKGHLDSVRHADEWDERMRATETSIATIDPRVRVENAQEIHVSHQHPPAQIEGGGWPPPQAKNVMPKLSELRRDD